MNDLSSLPVGLGLYSFLAKVRLGFHVASFALALFLMALLCFGSASVTWAETYHGQVVDAETGEPLKGAVIAVIWYKKPILAMGGINYFHNARETLTDSEGRFSLDASEGINWNPFTFVQEPRIIIYHPGYGPLAPTIPREFRDVYGIEDALKKGALIKLPKLKTKEEELRFADTPSLGGVRAPYEEVPNLIRAINLQRKMLGLQQFGETK
jgi:hypothetical protein